MMISQNTHIYLCHVMNFIFTLTQQIQNLQHDLYIYTSYILDACSFLNGSVSTSSLLVALPPNLFHMFYISLLVTGLNCFHRHRGDITVDTLTEFVSRALGRDSATVRRHYTTELTTTNFYEILGIPRQFKFLLLYKQGNKIYINSLYEYGHFQSTRRVEITDCSFDSYILFSLI